MAKKVTDKTICERKKTMAYTAANTIYAKTENKHSFNQPRLEILSKSHLILVNPISCLGFGSRLSTHAI